MREAGPPNFGPYVLLERIGDGGMAEIFLATRRGYSGFEKKIALKRILPRYSGKKTFAKMLIHEAKLAAGLQHFNIVQVLDLGSIEGQVYLAMEYVRGRDLAAVLSRAYRRKERIPVPVTLCIATEFLTGLDYAHRKRDDGGLPLGIIHRDVSPQNIMISYEGEVKLTDFGIARIISEKAELELPGTLHGKFGYMSPEQVSGRSIDQRSDIFSAGVVVWEMLTGQRLFRGKTTEDTVQAVIRKPVPRPSELNPDVPEAVDAAVMKALERDRDRRFQTVGALLGALTRAQAALDKRAVPRDVAVYMRRHFRSSRPPPEGLERQEAAAARRTLGRVMRDRGTLSTDDLDVALAEQRAAGGRLGEVLVQLGLASETEVGRALAEQHALPWVDETEARSLNPPAELARLPREAAEQLGVVPVAFHPSGTVQVLTHAPPESLLDVQLALGVEGIEPILTTRSGIDGLIDTWYGTAPGQSPSAPRILLADAEPDKLEELRARLEDETFEVWIATDGRQARRILDEAPVQAVVLDASLPRIDGLNVLLDIKGRTPDVPVFITSRRDDPEHASRALELGAEDYLTKPLAVGPVVSKIRKALARTGVSQAPSAGAGPDGVAGNLLSMSLVDLVQSLEIAAKNAVIELQYEDGRQGQVVLRQGRIVRCEPDQGDPDEAFFELARPGPGRFRVEYGPVAHWASNISAPNTFLMMEAMRRWDEDQSRQAAHLAHDLTLD
jgi:CheY-like chemotaxis protein